jgi:hypothetical protein
MLRLKSAILYRGGLADLLDRSQQTLTNRVWPARGGACH